jgi:hypothetical protein
MSGEVDGWSGLSMASLRPDWRLLRVERQRRSGPPAINQFEEAGSLLPALMVRRAVDSLGVSESSYY